MGSAKTSYKSICGDIEDSVLNDIIKLYESLFDDADISFFIQRLKTQPDTFSVLAYDGVRLIGFKIGYPKSPTIFYSWIGGVDRDYRQLGIAQQLLTLQEHYATDNGFKILQTKSMNRFKPMMILNLKNGFEITKFYTNSKSQTKIVFEKQLNNSSSE